MPATPAISPVGIMDRSTGVYRDANTWMTCPSTSPLRWPPRFQYAWFARFTGVALFSAVAFIRAIRWCGLDSW